MTTGVNRPFDDTTTGTLAQVTPQLSVCIDRDDINLPTSIIEVRNRPGAKNVMATKQVRFSFKPNKLQMIYRTSTTTGYQIDTDWKAFLDCANSDIPHYGLKFALEASSPSAAYVYEINMRYYVSFKGRRY